MLGHKCGETWGWQWGAELRPQLSNSPAKGLPILAVSGLSTEPWAWCCHVARLGQAQGPAEMCFLPHGFCRGFPSSPACTLACTLPACFHHRLCTACTLPNRCVRFTSPLSATCALPDLCLCFAHTVCALPTRCLCCVAAWVCGGEAAVLCSLSRETEGSKALPVLLLPVSAGL